MLISVFLFSLMLCGLLLSSNKIHVAENSPKALVNGSLIQPHFASPNQSVERVGVVLKE